MSRSISKKVNIVIVFVLMSLLINPVMYTGYGELGQEEIVSISMKTEYKWIKKVINGKMYRRLYDGKNKRWLSDWILIK